MYRKFDLCTYVYLAVPHIVFIVELYNSGKLQSEFNESHGLVTIYIVLLLQQVSIQHICEPPNLRFALKRMLNKLMKVMRFLREIAWNEGIHLNSLLREELRKNSSRFLILCKSKIRASANTFPSSIGKHVDPGVRGSELKSRYVRNF